MTPPFQPKDLLIALWRRLRGRCPGCGERLVRLAFCPNQAIRLPLPPAAPRLMQ